MLPKLFRYLISGYIFKRNKSNELVQKENDIVLNQSLDRKKFKVAVYTVITGKYDYLENPKYIDDYIDYYAVTDNKIENKHWKYIDLPMFVRNMTPLEQARFIKTHPHIFFKDYDVSIFIDGNVKIIDDIFPLINLLTVNNKIIGIHRHQSRDCIYDEAKAIYALGKAKLRPIFKQMAEYRKERFPRHFGLFETNVLIRFHNNPLCIELMEDWWSEMKKYTKRDQLSFTYVLWKHGLNCDFVQTIGSNSRKSTFFNVAEHV